MELLPDLAGVWAHVDPDERRETRRAVRGWPAKTDLEYAKTALELALLVIAVPWIVKRLVRDPGAAGRAASKKHLG